MLSYKYLEIKFIYTYHLYNYIIILYNYKFKCILKI